MRRVVIIAFAGAQGLDIFGPAEVFAGANRRGSVYIGYEVVIAAAQAGPLATTCGIPIVAQAIATIRPRKTDTIIVAGGSEDGVRAALGQRALSEFVAKAAKIARRVASVCSGAFVLAAAGLLDGKRCATHWSACAQLAAFRPAAIVDPEAIYVREGNVWTSAGVTTGIDMALALVEEDCGREVADAIAGRLVLHARRPGYQSQWSDALVAQRDHSAPFGRAVAWLRAHLRDPIDVERLAQYCAMSVRTLHRRCAEHLQMTPRQLIEKVRVDEARTLLETTGLPVKAIADRCGFADAAQLFVAFKRTLGLAPSEYRLVAA